MAIAHATELPRPPSACAPVPPPPPELDRLIMQCLAKEPTDRPADARELQRLLDGVPLAEPWSEERATAWWADRSAGARPSAPDLSRAPTLFHPGQR
jgi:hypothetical protein